MSLIKFLKGAVAPVASSDVKRERLVYASTVSLERALDGSRDAFYKYFFAVYHCSPDEDAGINTLREQLRAENPPDAVEVGDYFVLWGPSAFQALSWYYTALTKAESLPEKFREHATIRLAEITRKHEASQTLPHPVGLSEGQLSDDPTLNFYTCLALSNEQVFPFSG